MKQTRRKRVPARLQPAPRRASEPRAYDDGTIETEIRVESEDEFRARVFGSLG